MRRLRFGFKLPGHSQAHALAEKILAVIHLHDGKIGGEKISFTKAVAGHLSVLQRKGVSKSAHAELLAGAFAVFRREDRGVHVHGTALSNIVRRYNKHGKDRAHLLLKEFVHGSGQAAANSSHSADRVGAGADMGKVTQMLERQATF